MGNEAGAVERFDVSELGHLLRDRRGALSLRQAAAEAGVSFSTLSRVEGGAQPDLTTLIALCAWLGVSPSRFFRPATERDISPLDQAIGSLSADPRLSRDSAERIGALLRDLYAALAQDDAPPRRVAVGHFHSTSAMRPGVPQRLASLFADMNKELCRRAQAG